MHCKCTAYSPPGTSTMNFTGKKTTKGKNKQTKIYTSKETGWLFESRLWLAITLKTEYRIPKEWCTLPSFLL